MKISFDFDCTLGEPWIQLLASFLIKAGVEVWVITSRTPDYIIHDGKIVGNLGWNKDVVLVCERLNIPRERVVYTNGEFKIFSMIQHEIDVHFDDDYREVEHINRKGKHGILVGLELKNLAWELHNITDLDAFLKLP